MNKNINHILNKISNKNQGLRMCSRNPHNYRKMVQRRNLCSLQKITFDQYTARFQIVGLSLDTIEPDHA